MDGESVRYCKKLVDAIEEMLNVVPTEAPPGGLPPKLDPELIAPIVPYQDYHLLKGGSTEDYAGVGAEAKLPELGDLLSLPVKVDNLGQAVAAIVQCDNICEQLQARAVDASTSSKVINCIIKTNFF